MGSCVSSNQQAAFSMVLLRDMIKHCSLKFGMLLALVAKI